MKQKKDKDTVPTWIIIIGVVLILITLGWFIHQATKKRLAEKKEEDFDKIEDEEITKKRELERVQQLIEQKESRLEWVKKRLVELNKIKNEILIKEKRIYKQARIALALLIILGNGFYTFTWNWPIHLDTFLDFNAFVLLCYSFFAFISYGTPSGLIKGLKGKVSIYLQKRNIDTLEEISTLNDEMIALEKEIKELKNPITIFVDIG